MDGTNKVCAKCSKECKQFAQIVLVACPKFQSLRATQTPKTVDRAD